MWNVLIVESFLEKYTLVCIGFCEIGLCGRACSLIFTRASVAPQVLSSTPCKSEYSRI